MAVYEQWLAHRRLSLEERRQTSLEQIGRVFKKDVFPSLRHLTIYEITRAHLVDIIGKVEKRGSLSVAEKLRTWFTQLFTYAPVAIPNMGDNPSRDLEVLALPLPPVEHNPFLRMHELPVMLQTLRKYRGLNTQLGIRLLMLTGVRTGELRFATPDQFDLDRGLWIIPVARLKQRALLTKKKRKRLIDIPPYIVPLSVQAQEIVRHLLDQCKPAQVHLIPGDWCLKNPISENTLNAALKRMGYEDQLTGHGIRATISTALNELGYPKKWVDAQLSHADPDKISATYNHAEYVEQRRVMMQDWADRLDLFEQNQVEVASRHLTITLVDDEARIGALRLFDPQSGAYLRAGGANRHVPPLAELERVLHAARALEDGTESAQDLRYLLGQGTSLGGARPKSTVRDTDRRLAVGKFPSQPDRRDVIRGEVLAMQLAAKAGIRVAPARVKWPRPWRAGAQWPGDWACAVPTCWISSRRSSNRPRPDDIGRTYRYGRESS